MKMKNKLSSFELKSKFDAGAIPFPEDFHQIINESGKINDLLKVDEIFHTDAEGRLTIPVEKDSGLFISEGLLSVNLKENGGGEFNSDGFLTVKEGDSVSFDDFFFINQSREDSSISLSAFV
ncbi:hypothetical protein [Escherichia sp. E1130]|uniref:hypothetical protein n=1 Tax=Escherichia sp. E1130 TaxID=2041645 RepID=UPI0010818767|nr:hypothetical protein [Escherichia sp. E1130]TGC24426.1 hypothetical protein CQJ27_14260 [Escherichia sp. E1130]